MTNLLYLVTLPYNPKTLEVAMTTKRQKKKNKKKGQVPKERNWIAVGAIQRKAGAHKDRKKERNKKACRGRHKEQ